MKHLRFFEYGGFQDSSGKESFSIADTQLTPAEIQCLNSLSESVVPNKSIFDISQTKIRANSIVGVIAYDGVHIEILPKLLKSNSDSSSSVEGSILKNLMFMLSYTNELDVSDSGIGNLSLSADSFIEAYISIFANRLSQHLIRFGTPKAYVERDENLNTVKGKIAFARHSTINFFDQSRVYCEFSEFTEDNGLSRAFKFVSCALLQLTRNASSIATLNRCIGLLDGVKPEFVTNEDIDHLSIGKRNSNLIALINLTKMFLKKLRPDFSGRKKNKMFTLLFDMNELFEEFIFKVLKRNELALGIKVTSQKKKRLVSAERDFSKDASWVDRSMFDTYTDIAVQPKSGPGFIIDTKYKLVHSGKSHYGISNQDAYQVLAYRQIHKEVAGEPSVCLLYPKSTEDIRKEFRVNGSNTTFMAWTIDISIDLQSSMELLVGNLRNLIEVATSQKTLAAA